MDDLATAPLTVGSQPIAQTPCERCGNFASLALVGARRLCPVCRRRSDAFESGPMEATALLGHVWQLVGPTILPATFVLFLFSLPAMLMQFAGQDGMPLTFFDGIFGMVSTAAVIHMARNALYEEPIDPKGSVLEALKSFADIFVANWLTGLIVFFFFLLLIIPGVLKSLSYAIVVPIVLFESHSGLDALKASAARMLGSRSSAFMAYLATSLPALLVFGFFFLMAFIASAVDAFVDPNGLTAPIISDALFDQMAIVVGGLVTVALLPLHLLTFVLYVRTRKRSNNPWL